MSKPHVLFLTSPEHGQANVHLAVIASFRERYAEDVEIHIAAFESFRSRVPEGVTYHSLVGNGLAYHHAKAAQEDPDPAKRAYGGVDRVLQTPGFFGALMASTRIVTVLHPEPVEEYVASAQNAERVIKEVRPTFVVIDPLFNAGRDALKKTRIPYALLHPISIKEAARTQQGAAIFGWPATGTGFPYPLPWYLYPMNIFAMLWTVLWVLKLDKKAAALDAVRNQAGYPGHLPSFVESDILTFCNSTPGAELPAIIPDKVICCGPIVQSSKPVSQVDPELSQWLSRRPTVLVALGSHMSTPDFQAREMLQAFRILLEKRKDVQVLWKLHKAGQYELEGVEEAGERLRVVSWLEADPLAILQSGNVVCNINHGGGNSYHEALLTGTPQVILPAWYDCYDVAGRIEYIGVGRWGNMTSAPYCSEKDLTAALTVVVGATPDAPEAKKIQARAKEISRIVTHDGTRIGRDVAADRIWQEVQAVQRKLA